MEFIEVDFEELIGEDDDGDDYDGYDALVASLEEIMVISTTVFNGRLDMEMVCMDDMTTLLNHCREQPGDVCVVTYPYDKDGGRDGNTVLLMVGHSLEEIKNSVRKFLEVSKVHNA